MMGVEIQIQQALFGYESGHHLLASSVRLEPEHVKRLAVATDLSGSVADWSDNACAYTGFPLVGTAYYALFATWLATEKKRPGCVWSHVLLIEVADLASLKNTEIFRSYFSRPKEQLESYGRPLFLDSNEVELTAPPLADREGAELLLKSLYGEPAHRIVVLAEKAERFENLVFGIWSQQWPRLRRNFRFSTYSLSDRSGEDFDFDIQVAPRKSRRTWLNQPGKIIIIDPEDNLLEMFWEGQTQSVGEWIDSATSDLLKPDESHLRFFLRDDGYDVGEPRHSFAKLVRCHSAIAAFQSDWKRVLDLVAKEFSDPQDAKQLKQDCIEPTGRSPVFGGDLIARRLAGLEWMFVGSSSAFMHVAINIEETVVSAWERTEFRERLLYLVANEPAKKVEEGWVRLARSVALQVMGHNPRKIWEKKPEIFLTLIRMNPLIATDAQIWDIPERAQWRVMEALESRSLAPEVWLLIAKTLLRAGNTTLVQEVFKISPTAVFDAALEWVSYNQEDPLPHAWREVIRNGVDKLAENISCEPNRIALYVSMLSVSKAERIPITSEIIKTLVEVDLTTFPTALRLSVAFFLVTVGLRGNGPRAETVLAHGFFETHESLARENDPPESWRMLQRCLPAFRDWEWDRCDKLRTAVHKWFAHNGGGEVFVRNARTPDERALALLLTAS